MHETGSGVRTRIAHALVINCLMLTVVGCNDGSSSAGADAPPAGDPPHVSPPTGNALLDDVEAYMAVVRNPPNADDCPDPSRAHLCPAGARSGTRTGKAVHDWISDRLTTIPGMRDVQQHSFTIPRFAPDGWHIRVTSADGSVLEPASLPWFFSGFPGRTPVQAPLLDVAVADCSTCCFRPTSAGESRLSRASAC